MLCVSSSRRIARVLLLICLASLLAPPVAHSVTLTWAGRTSGYWLQADSWTPTGVSPINAYQTLVFSSPTPGADYPLLSTNNSMFSPSPVQRIEITQAGHQIWGNALALSNLVARIPPGTSSWVCAWVAASPFAGYSNAPLNITVVSNNSTLRLWKGLDLSLSEYGVSPNNGALIQGAGDTVIYDLYGSGHLSKSGTGDLWLTGPGTNLYTGDIFVTNGILRLDRQVVGIPANRGDLVVGSGSTGPVSAVIALERDNQIYRDSEVTILGTGQLDLNDNDASFTELRMTGGSVVTGDGTLAIPTVRVSPASSESSISGRLALGVPGYNVTAFTILAGARLRLGAVISGGNQLLRK